MLDDKNDKNERNKEKNKSSYKINEMKILDTNKKVNKKKDKFLNKKRLNCKSLDSFVIFLNK